MSECAPEHSRAPGGRPVPTTSPLPKEHPMTVCLPATEVISIDAMASVDTVVWWCRLCDHHGTATTRPTAHSEGIEHLSAEHHATIGTAP